MCGKRNTPPLITGGVLLAGGVVLRSLVGEHEHETYTAFKFSTVRMARMSQASSETSIISNDHRNQGTSLPLTDTDDRHTLVTVQDGEHLRRGGQPGAAAFDAIDEFE